MGDWETNGKGRNLWVLVQQVLYKKLLTSQKLADANQNNDHKLTSVLLKKIANPKESDIKL